MFANDTDKLDLAGREDIEICGLDGFMSFWYQVGISSKMDTEILNKNRTKSSQQNQLGKKRQLKLHKYALTEQLQKE